MKFEFSSDFGFAKRGDSLTIASPVDPAQAYWRGWLRTTRRYTEFVAPRSALHLVASSDANEDIEYHARRSDPSTSHAEMLRHGEIHSERERRILAAVKHRASQGATSKEVTELTGIPHVSTSTTMSKLRKRGLLAELHTTRSGALVRVLPEFSPDPADRVGLQQ